MKLSVNEESIIALREWAETILWVCNKLVEDVIQLLNTFNSISEDVGPHREAFKEMFTQLNNVQVLSNDSIKELAYMLKCTADKIEAYINYGVPYRTIALGNVDFKKQYYIEANKRINLIGTNPIVKDLYREYYNFIRIDDYECEETPFYNVNSHGINLSAMEDLNNPRGRLTTYFHEVGHMIDDYAGNGHTWLSANTEFSKALRNDIEYYINQVIISKHCEYKEACDIISEEISGYWNAGVSDIFGSITECKCQGDWGHHITYWESDPTSIEKEAFANMFEASIGCEKKLEQMKYFFPSAYDQFEYIIRSR